MRRHAEGKRNLLSHQAPNPFFILLSPHVGRSCSRLSGPHLTCSSPYVSIFFIPSLSHTRPPQVPLLPFCREAGNSSGPVQLPGQCSPSLLHTEKWCQLFIAPQVLGGSYRDIRALGLPEVQYLNLTLFYILLYLVRLRFCHY